MRSFIYLTLAGLLPSHYIAPHLRCTAARHSSLCSPAGKRVSALSPTCVREGGGGISKPRHALTVAVIVQNEARWLPEWLEYHLLPQVGVEHFYVYDDDSAGAGSTDGLAATVAPYVEAALLTLHAVSSLGPLPTHSLTCASRGACHKRPLDFRQQAAMVRHAAATYGRLSRAMIFIDVDEFLLYEAADQAVRGASALHPDGRSAATAIVTALSARDVGGLRLESSVMLPNETLWAARGAAANAEAGLVLTRDYVRQLVPASNATERKARGELAFGKSIVAPRALALLGGHERRSAMTLLLGGGGGNAAMNATHFEYGSIHSLALRPGLERRMASAHGLRLLHFRYRSAANFAARANRTYLQQGQRGTTEKRSSMSKWRESLQQTFRAKERRSSPQLGLLSSWGSLAAALAQRWAGRVAPPAVAALLDAARAVASKVAVLLVSEPRSGSSLVGELAFDVRPDFVYSFEPCRLALLRRTRIDGTYFDRRRGLVTPPSLPTQRESGASAAQVRVVGGGGAGLRPRPQGLPTAAVRRARLHAAVARPRRTLARPKRAGVQQAAPWRRLGRTARLPASSPPGSR